MANAAPVLSNYVNGAEVASTSTETLDVLNPATQELLCRIPCSTQEEMEACVANAVQAQKSWREVPVQQRARVLMKLVALLHENKDEIAKAIVRENGKTYVDAEGDVFRGIEVVEHAVSMPALMMGESTEQISKNMDTVTLRQPLGIVAGIAPFNFPAMIVLWMLPIAVGTGNAFILKPSERVPTASMVIARLATQAGLPPGIFNIIHGAKSTVDFLCDHPLIRAVSFVGSTLVGRHVHARATAAGKRCQCNVGAKNHAVVLPDANRDQAIAGIIGAAFGAAGQRCMAISVVVFVGAAADWLPVLVERARALRVGCGADAGVDVGPMITRAAVARAERIIADSLAQGAAAALDGRGPTVPSHPNGNFLAPTILTGVTPTMPCYTEEVFAPVLCVVSAPTLDAALHLVNASPMGNGVALFTSSGGAARRFQHEVEVGQIGINVPVPVPLPFFSWSSSKGSLMGEHHFYGKSAVDFYTQIKTVVSRWEYAEPAAAGAGGAAAAAPADAPALNFARR